MVVRIKQGITTKWWNRHIGEEYVVGNSIWSPELYYRILQGPRRTLIILKTDCDVIDASEHTEVGDLIVFQKRERA